MPPTIHFTLGPASWPAPILQGVIAAGVDACRINLSHTQPAQLPEWFAHARAAAAAIGCPLRVGADLRGRKLRVGPLAGGQVTLVPGARFMLIPVAAQAEAPGNGQQASVNCPTLGEIARPGDEILLDDGALRLHVETVTREAVTCVVAVGGALPERSGFNLPGRAIALPPLTVKDEADLDALATVRPDFVYLSYVETAGDIRALREALARRRLTVPIIAKIERAVALDHIAEIASAVDALCLARGDLGVEVSLPRLPYAQREVVAAAHAAGTPLLLAGEVMLTLVGRSTPSRAELTDIVVAVEQGCAGFVLSDETAIGCDPVAAVRWLRDVAAGR